MPKGHTFVVTEKAVDANGTVWGKLTYMTYSGWASLHYATRIQGKLAYTGETLTFTSPTPESRFNITDSVTVTWNPISDATKYLYTVYDDEAISTHYNSDGKAASGTLTSQTSITVNNLYGGKRYRVVVTAYKADGTTLPQYSNVHYFYTKPAKPFVNAPDATDITISGGTLQGNIISNNGEHILEYGIMYSKSPDADFTTYTFPFTQGKTGKFSYAIDGYEQGETIYYIAYARNFLGTTYSEVNSFRTIKKVTGVTLSDSEIAITKGDNFTLTPHIIPEDATDLTVSWKSSDTNIATVENGLITAVNGGTATITVTTNDGAFEATCVVTVTIKVEKVVIEEVDTELTVGDKATLNITVSPDNATDKSVTWSSDNSSIVSVDENGNIEALAEGEATVTVTTNDGKFFNSVKFTVKRLPYTYTITYDANGGSYAPAPQTKVENEDYYISTQEPTKDGYTFKGWALTKDSKTVDCKADSLYNENKDLTLYAVWGRSFATFMLKDGSKYVIDKQNRLLLNVSEQSSVYEVLDNFLNDNIVITTKESDTVLGDDVIVGTSYVLNLIFEGDVFETLTVVIKGDIDGNGTVDSTDLIMIRRILLKTYEVKNEFAFAADTDGVNDISSNDYIQIRRHIIHTYNLFD